MAYKHMLSKRRIYQILQMMVGTAVWFVNINFALAQESDNQPHSLYRSPEERREAGVGYQITDSIKISALVEIEREEIDFEFFDTDSPAAASRPTFAIEENNTVSTAQLGLEFKLTDFATAEIIVESEDDRNTTTVLDEAVLVLEFDPLEFEIGKLSVPFGEYYSHFVSGPMLEFSETNGEALVINYQMTEGLEISTFLFRSKLDISSDGGNVDWGSRLEWQSDNESIKFGVGYLSDLAESDELLLDDLSGQYQNRVAAINSYLLLGFEHFEITAEHTAALDDFLDLDSEFNKPRATNLELSWFITQRMQLSFRFETSNKFADNPEKRYGVNFSWLPFDKLQLSIEYLQSEYKSGFVFDDDEQELTSDSILGARITYEF